MTVDTTSRAVEIARGHVKVRQATSLGDDDSAFMLTVEASFVPDAPPITLPGARLYLIEDDKIAVEQVVFLIPD